MDALKARADIPLKVLHTNKDSALASGGSTDNAYTVRPDDPRTLDDPRAP